MVRPVDAPIKIGERTFKYLHSVMHTRMTSTGAIDELRCKMCGAVIAGQVERVVDSRIEQRAGVAVLVERVRTGFQRYANFCEAQIDFEDGQSPHITTGCTKCMDPGLLPKHIIELYQADIIDLNWAGAQSPDEPSLAYPPIPDYYKDRIPVKLTKLARYTG